MLQPDERDQALVDIGSALHLAIERSAWTQLQVAQRAGVSPNTLWRVLTGRELLISTLIRLADAAGCNVEIRIVRR